MALAEKCGLCGGKIIKETGICSRCGFRPHRDPELGDSYPPRARNRSFGTAARYQLELFRSRPWKETHVVVIGFVPGLAHCLLMSEWSRGALVFLSWSASLVFVAISQTETQLRLSSMSLVIMHSWAALDAWVLFRRRFSPTPPAPGHILGMGALLLLLSFALYSCLYFFINGISLFQLIFVEWGMRRRLFGF